MPEQKKITVLNKVGARLWELADGRRSVADMAHVIATEYEVSQSKAEVDVLAFCRDLARTWPADLELTLPPEDRRRRRALCPYGRRRTFSSVVEWWQIFQEGHYGADTGTQSPMRSRL